MGHLIFDIEITTHCNATCTFCPRDSIPFLQHMELSTLERIIERLQELPNKPTITFCGTGDCSTHPKLVEMVARLSPLFPDFKITTNGIRINEKRTHELLDAGLSTIVFSVSEIGADYDKTYGHSFERVLKNICYFREVAEDRCKVIIAPMARQHRDSRVKEMKSYWHEQGFYDFLVMDISNRAGTLDESYKLVDGADFDQIFAADKTLGLCPIPFVSTLIGPDGGYYLCSHDFKKQRVFGSIFTHSIVESWKLKQKYFNEDRQACAGCSANPLSRFAQKYAHMTASKYRDLLDSSEMQYMNIWGFNLDALFKEINTRLEE